ncbi:MAG: RNA 2',3'-cyclic phosphodiesterase [Spirochaetia bacterium]
MRVFAALPLPRAAVDSISALIAPVRRENPRLRWVSESAYHLTMHFFGELDDGAVGALARVFQEPRLSRPPLPTRLGPLGQFPPNGSPRVLWIALADDAGDLRSYWELFMSFLSPLGWKPDRRGFTPHVTLARNNGSQMTPGWNAAVQPSDFGFSISECVLFQSILGRGGSQYVPLQRIAFGGGAA